MGRSEVVVVVGDRRWLQFVCLLFVCLCVFLKDWDRRAGGKRMWEKPDEKGRVEGVGARECVCVSETVREKRRKEGRQQREELVEKEEDEERGRGNVDTE